MSKIILNKHTKDKGTRKGTENVIQETINDEFN